MSHFLQALAPSNWTQKKDALGTFKECLVQLRQKVSGFNSSGTDITQTSHTTRTKSKKGEVFLVGAGPGQADLLTIRAYNAIKQAEVVLVDWLVSHDVRALIPNTAHVEFVGKRAGKHSVKQEEINALLVRFALDGKRVVRLKGGDPSVFGRTAEEVEALDKHQIQYAIVPGITAAAGASASSGIPLTLREKARSVRFITAHHKDAKQEPDWQSLACASDQETLVFYMGLGRLEKIAQRLVEFGVDKGFPIAVIDKACSSEQKICIGELDNIAQKVNDQKLTGPSLIVVGHVVKNQFSVSTELLNKLAKHVVE